MWNRRECAGASLVRLVSEIWTMTLGNYPARGKEKRKPTLLVSDARIP
jgi:hypothetical protein